MTAAFLAPGQTLCFLTNATHAKAARAARMVLQDTSTEAPTLASRPMIAVEARRKTKR
jgi:hypothetical protein